MLLLLLLHLLPLHNYTRTQQVPVVFFSLLRKGTPDRDRSEAKLAEAFDYVSEKEWELQSEKQER